MIRRPPRSTRTDTLFPFTTLCRSDHVHASCAESAKAYLVARQDTARLFHPPFQIIDPDGAIRNGTDHVRSQHMRNGFILMPQHRIGEARCYTREFECLLEMDVPSRVQPIS